MAAVSLFCYSNTAAIISRAFICTLNFATSFLKRLHDVTYTIVLITSVIHYGRCFSNRHGFRDVLGILAHSI